MRMLFRMLPVALLFAVASGGCMRSIVEELPSAPGSPPASAPSPAPVGPAPSPTPTIIPTPVPPTPEPTPAPPVVSACNLPRGTGNGFDCPRTSPAFLGDVQAAINQVIAEQPEIFKKRDCLNCYDATDPDAFVAGVVQQLSRRGYCAMYDGEELAVKNTNTFNEQFDILSASMGVRSGTESYRATCRPAWF